MLEKQKTQMGNNSSSIMVGRDINQTINGLTYGEVKDICNDLFQLNFYQLKADAAAIATKRAEEIVNNFISKLRNLENVDTAVFKEPDMQYALVNAQIVYAKTGDKEIEDLLVNLLIERVNSNENELSKIILNESLKVIELLTKNHLNILATIFFMRYVKNNSTNKSQILDHFEVILQFMKQCTNINTEIIFDHLSYSKCITQTNGFMYPARSVFENYIKVYFGIDVPEDYNELNELLKTEVCFREIIELWDNSRLCSAFLTSVGKALAITYIRSQGIMLPYSQWLNCDCQDESKIGARLILDT